MQLLGVVRGGAPGRATAAGASSFMSAFNMAYCAASPIVAYLERVRPRSEGGGGGPRRDRACRGRPVRAEIVPAAADLSAPVGPHAAHVAGAAGGASGGATAAATDTAAPAAESSVLIGALYVAAPCLQAGWPCAAPWRRARSRPCPALPATKSICRIEWEAAATCRPADAQAAAPARRRRGRPWGGGGCGQPPIAVMGLHALPA